MELEKMNNLAANYFCTLFNSLGYLLFKTTCRNFGNFVYFTDKNKFGSLQREDPTDT